MTPLAGHLGVIRHLEAPARLGAPRPLSRRATPAAPASRGPLSAHCDPRPLGVVGHTIQRPNTTNHPSSVAGVTTQA